MVKHDELLISRIAVSRRTLNRLASHRMVKRESYDEVINRLMDRTEKNEKNKKL